MREKQPVNYYSLLPTVKDMAEPGEVLSKIENLSKLYHQAKCRMSDSNEPLRSLRMYDTKIAEELIRDIKNSDDHRQNPPSRKNEDDKSGKEGSARKGVSKNVQDKGIQL